MSYQERTAKFQACAGRVLPDSKTAELWGMLETLEQQTSLVPLMELLRG